MVRSCESPQATDEGEGYGLQSEDELSQIVWVAHLITNMINNACDSCGDGHPFVTNSSSKTALWHVK